MKLNIIGIVLLSHTFERLSFLSIGAIVPFVLWESSQITTSQFGLFFMILFFSYRITPLFTGYFSDSYSKTQSLIMGAIIESLGLLGILFSNNIEIILLFSLMTGIGGGLFATTILSILNDIAQKENKNSNIYLSHFMLINLAAFFSPLFILLNDNMRIYLNLSILLLLIITTIIIKEKIRENKNSQKQLYNYFNSMKKMIYNTKFLNLWLLSILVWSSCSFIYSIIPVKKLLEGEISNINIWLMLDASVTIILFFIIKKFKFFTKIKFKFIMQGISILGVSLILFSFSNNIFMISVSVFLLAIGGTISFPQIYGMMAKIAPRKNKTQYIGMLSVAGAIGEGGIQGIFSLFPNSNAISLYIGLLIMFIAMYLKITHKSLYV